MVARATNETLAEPAAPEGADPYLGGLAGGAGVPLGPDTAWEAPMFDHGAWLVERRGVMDSNEAAWLEVLDEFNRKEGWAADGQLCCAAWLMWRCGMARSTAYEKLALARELRRRPVVQAAFAAG